MQTPKRHWDTERASAWLRSHGWGNSGELPAPPLAPPQPVAVAAVASVDQAALDDEIDIACWPALVAPFYD